MAETEPELSDEVILRSLYGPLRAFAAVVAPPDVAPDDLVHDAIVRTLQRQTLSRLAQPLAYLRRAVVNEASNSRRRFLRQRRALTRLAGSTPESAVDHYPTDLAHLGRLEPRARAVLYLREVEGHGYDEIAADLDLSEANVRQIASRARARLRHHIEEAS